MSLDIEPTTQSDIAKFKEVLEWLEGDNKTPVSEESLIIELLLSNNFTLENAENMIRSALRQGILYESKPNHYNLLKEKN